MAEESTAPNWFDPFWQSMPECRAALDLLRILNPHFTPVQRELTDAEWTAFRLLAQKGAAEGIILLAYTHVDGTPREEHLRVQGDYAKDVGKQPIIRADDPVTFDLEQVRLTGRGEQWANYLRSEEKDPTKARGFVLSLIWNAATEQGHARSLAPNKVPGSSGNVPLVAVPRASKSQNVAAAPVMGSETGSMLTELQPSIEKFAKDHPNLGRCGFVMMRIRDSDFHNGIYAAITDTCGVHGLLALRADRKGYSDDLLPNVRAYMHGCGFGIAVFEQHQTDEFNPNVALEVGYMMALGKPICLLKERKVKQLPTDLIGRLYRQFDGENVDATVKGELETWLAEKGLIPERSSSME